MSINSSDAQPLTPVSKRAGQRLGFKDATSPLDFIQKNLEARQTEATGFPPSGEIVPRPEPEPTPVPLGPPQPIPATIPPNRDEPATQQPSLIQSLEAPYTPAEKPEMLVGEPEVPDTDTETDSEDDLEDETDVESEEHKKGPKKSIRALRKIANEAKNQLQLTQAQLESITAERDRLQSGEETPAKLQEYESRIKELERYERLHALKLSSEYKDKYATPLQTLREQARELAKEYEVNPQVLDQALSINTKKELNAYLRKHFDDVGTLEARDVLSKYKALVGEAQQAEAEPGQELERLKAERAELERQAEEARINTIITQSRRGWESALNEVQARSDFPELHTANVDPDTLNISKPIVEMAAKEFGAIMKLIGALGVKELPEHAVKILAQRFLLSQAAGVIAQSRAQHSEMSETVQHEAKRVSHYQRPQVGSNGQGAPAAPSQVRARVPGQKAADLLLESALQKRHQTR